VTPLRGNYISALALSICYSLSTDSFLLQVEKAVWLLGTLLSMTALFKLISAEFSSSSVRPEKAYTFQSKLTLQIATEAVFQKFISGKGQLLLK